MLISLFAWIYISLICLIWGHLVLRLTNHATVPGERRPSVNAAPDTNAAPGASAAPDTNAAPGGSATPGATVDPAILCMGGLSAIAVFAMGWSIILPVDWKAHLVISLPAFAWLIKSSNRTVLGAQISSFLTIPPIFLALFGALLLMILVMSGYEIRHPDTLEYHAKNVLLFQEYKAIPGIANLKGDIGFQSAWLACLAIFQPIAPRQFHMLFLNGAVLGWFAVFIVRRMALDKNNTILWCLLLIYTLVSYTQIRLTATSASPDFIVTLFCWAAVWLYLQRPSVVNTTFIMLCCVAAVVTKLSAIPILLLAAISLFTPGTGRLQRWPLFIWGAFALGILMIRNYIASGYPLYPASVFSFLPADWKMRPESIERLQQYIKLYARTPLDTEDIGSHWRQPMQVWIPHWWDQLALIDRTLIVLVLCGWLRRVIRPWRLDRYDRVLIVMLAGTALWFLQAPHPRFGTAYLIPMVYLLYRDIGFSIIPDRLIPVACGSVLAAILAYTGYRCIHFVKPSEIFLPSGIAPAAYAPIGCEDIRVDILNDRIDKKEGARPSSCKSEYFMDFSLRGETIGDGFRPGLQVPDPGR